jgi:hypothetical protein
VAFSFLTISTLRSASLWLEDEVKGGPGSFEALALPERASHVNVLVHGYDESPDPPVVVEHRSPQEHGAGMRLVAALADSWGVASRGDGRLGKRVWFALG